MGGRGGDTLGGVVARLHPLGGDQLGLGLHHHRGEGGGAHLHVLDVVLLGADRLGDVVALVVVLDDDAARGLLLVAVRGEGGDAHLARRLHVVQLTRALVRVAPHHPGPAHAGGDLAGVAAAGLVAVLLLLVMYEGCDLGLVLAPGQAGQQGADYESPWREHGC